MVHARRAHHLAHRALYSFPYRRAIIGRKRNMYLPIKDVGRLTCAEYNAGCISPIILTGAVPFANERDALNFISRTKTRSSAKSSSVVHRMSCNHGIMSRKTAFSHSRRERTYSAFPALECTLWNMLSSNARKDHSRRIRSRWTLYSRQIQLTEINFLEGRDFLLC